MTERGQTPVEHECHGCHGYLATHEVEQLNRELDDRVLTLLNEVRPLCRECIQNLIANVLENLSLTPVPRVGNPEHMSRREAAEALGLRPQTLSAWRSRGQYQDLLPAHAHGQYTWYARTDVEAFHERLAARDSRGEDG